MCGLTGHSGAYTRCSTPNLLHEWVFNPGEGNANDAPSGTTQMMGPQIHTSGAERRRGSAGLPVKAMLDK